MIQHLSITSGVPMPGVNTSNIPLHPRKEDFKHVRFWANKPWQKLRNNVKSDDLKLPIFSMFMEDEFGREISEDIKDTLRGDLGSYWSDIHDSGEILYNYTELGHHRKEHFRMTFESKYPWLRLCDGHWKVNQLWINYFGKWRKRGAPTRDSSDTSNVLGDKTPSPNDPKEKTPIEISSDLENVPAGFKRGREDNQDPQGASAKRHKGKRREVEHFDFHPPRPQPKKVNAKIAKVSVFVLLFCRTFTETNI